MKQNLERVQQRTPLIHCITNYVTVNDVANLLLACGASPVMADEAEEMDAITGQADGLYLNLGTINTRTFESMRVAGRKAAEKGIPIVLDPVGVGASPFRSECAKTLLKELPIAVIRGNISEIRFLMGQDSAQRGVDAGESDALSNGMEEELLQQLRAYAEKQNCLLAISGKTDLICSAEAAYFIHNGHPMMAKVTGTGCQLSALVCAYLAANEDPLDACATAVSLYGYAGEIALQTLTAHEGNATYRTRIIDAVHQCTADEWEGGARYEKRSFA